MVKKGLYRDNLHKRKGGDIYRSLGDVCSCRPARIHLSVGLIKLHPWSSLPSMQADTPLETVLVTVLYCFGEGPGKLREPPQPCTFLVSFGSLPLPSGGTVPT